MLEKWANEVGEGTETEAERALSMLAMMGVMDKEKGRRGEPAACHELAYAHPNPAF